MGGFVRVTSCDLRVDNKLFERWNYGIMISLNLLFRTLLWLFLYQDMEGNIDWLNSPAAVISLSSSYPMQIFQQFSNSFQMIRNISVPVTRKWQMPESTHCKEMPLSFKLLLLQLGFKCSAAADKLRFILLGSQYLRTLNQAFPFFFLVVFTSECAEIHVHFSSCLGRPMETSWRNAASRHRDNVHVYDKWPVWGEFRVDQPTSTCLKWHTSITVYLQRTPDRLKFPWKKVQHSESGWYAHDLWYMFVVTSSSPSWKLNNFF